MPALANPRHERFAQAIVQGLGASHGEVWSQGRAYVSAGYNAKDAGKRGGSAEAAASRLLNRVKPILDRVREIQEQHAKRHAVTIDTIRDELEQARALAISEKQTSAAVAASTTKAKLYGLFVDRHEHGTPGTFEQAKSTRDIAEGMLREANPALGEIDAGMREMALAELARHADALVAIAFMRPGQITQA